MKQVAMIGEGAWGTAVATLLANNNIQVNLWCYDEQVCDEIKKNHSNNRYLPQVPLSDRIKPTHDLAQALAESELIFEAIPVQYMRSVLEKCRPHVRSDHKWIVLSKGIENNSLLLPTQLIDEVIVKTAHKAVLVGPSFASDVATQQITAVTLAATDCEFGLMLQKLLANNYFRPYLSLDVIGVQIGGALKNVIALAIGMLDGAGYRDNVKAFVLSRGLHEMMIVSQLRGGRPETIYGLSGVGDLVLTAMGARSRNREVGKRIGAGQTLETILYETGYIPEGVNTAISLHQLIEQFSLDLPVCKGVFEVLMHGKKIETLLADLMNRPLEQECVVK
ncbi:MAG: Glycerol-3-phosphate dehydrogenase (NAD(P)+) [Candidatus Dependentiae bacterium ADurb.Bin331]|nr:MAG: Glycerol-3-phosphate dehydrogenase (NAD(P)+) [Candidatus Dependentiae bacterium ADurb.Bin331]